MKKIKNVFITVLLSTIVLMLFSINVNAASATISAPSEATVGEEITISVSGTGVQWNLSLLVDGTEIAKSQELENYDDEKKLVDDFISNLDNNSNKISEKSSTYISINQDCKCNSIEKVPKYCDSNIKNSEFENKIGRICYNRENIEKQIYDMQNKMVSSKF